MDSALLHLDRELSSDTQVAIYPVRRGMANGGRFTDEQVFHIRGLHADGVTVGAIARQYMCALAQISTIVRGKSYAHVGGSIATVARYASCKGMTLEMEGDGNVPSPYGMKLHEEA